MMFGKRAVMTPLVKRRTSVTSGIAAVLLLASCSEKKDLSPPPVNAAPRDKLELVVAVEGHESDYPATVKVQYGNLSKDCSNIDYRYGLGGNIDFPKGDVPIAGDKGKFEIYRDYYEPREGCSWGLLGVDITIHAPNGRHADTGISRRDFNAGFKWNVRCQFFRDDVNICFPPEPPGDLVSGIDVSIQIK
ncbi:hypothetical protein [Dyella sp. EPa41]|uniref:hypothetical protein n=1 Tax=Dyella sp. EPa41 TaxID=1561194 RepID=UPI0019152DA4|nr:hypothetical protein [Dyella sp. EPa41]